MELESAVEQHEQSVTRYQEHKHTPNSKEELNNERSNNKEFHSV